MNLTERDLDVLERLPFGGAEETFEVHPRKHRPSEPALRRLMDAGLIEVETRRCSTWHTADSVHPTWQDRTLWAIRRIPGRHQVWLYGVTLVTVDNGA